MVSRPGESLGEFRVRVCQILRERHDEQVAKLKAKYAPALRTLSDQIRRAEERVERERAQSGQQKMNTMLSVGATLLGAFLGRGRSRIGTVGRAATAMKSASRISKERADVVRAEESLEVLQQRLRDLEQQFETATASLSAAPHPETLQVETRSIRPRKSDILIETFGLCWVPPEVFSGERLKPYPILTGRHPADEITETFPIRKRRAPPRYPAGRHDSRHRHRRSGRRLADAPSDAMRHAPQQETLDGARGHRRSILSPAQFGKLTFTAGDPNLPCYTPSIFSLLPQPVILG
jgi:hypothetical protein